MRAAAIADRVLVAHRPLQFPYVDKNTILTLEHVESVFNCFAENGRNLPDRPSEWKNADGIDGGRRGGDAARHCISMSSACLVCRRSGEDALAAAESALNARHRLLFSNGPASTRRI